MKKQIDIDYKLEKKVEKELDAQIAKDGKIDKITDEQRAVLESYYCGRKRKIFRYDNILFSIDEFKKTIINKTSEIEEWLKKQNLAFDNIEIGYGCFTVLGWTNLTDEELISKYMPYYKAEQNKLAKDKAKKAKEKQKAAKSKINTKKDAEKLIKLLKEKFDI